MDPLIIKLIKHHNIDNKIIVNSGSKIIKEFLPGDDFSYSQWHIGLKYFKNRISHLKLNGNLCLDFGCGAGNWSIAASYFYKNVIGFDKHSKRIQTAKKIAEELKIKNVEFSDSSETLNNLKPGSVDLIIVYNVIGLISRNRKELFISLYNLLKKDGIMLCSFNEVGVLPFYFINGVTKLKPRRINDTIKMTGYFLYNNLLKKGLPFERTYGWLNTNQFLSFAGTLGLEPVWQSWLNGYGSENKNLFPEKYGPLPFFREVLFKKL